MRVRNVTNARKPVTKVTNEDSVGRQPSLATRFKSWLAFHRGSPLRPAHRRPQIDPISDIASQISIRAAGSETVEAWSAVTSLRATSFCEGWRNRRGPSVIGRTPLPLAGLLKVPKILDRRNRAPDVHLLVKSSACAINGGSESLGLPQLDLCSIGIEQPRETPIRGAIIALENMESL
jgi:hypothetical protein